MSLFKQQIEAFEKTGEKVGMVNLDLLGFPAYEVKHYLEEAAQDKPHIRILDAGTALMIVNEKGK